MGQFSAPGTAAATAGTAAVAGADALAGTAAVAGAAAVTGGAAVICAAAVAGVAVTVVAVRGAVVTLVVAAAPHPGADAATKAPAAIQRPTWHVRERRAGQGLVTVNAVGLHRSLNIPLAFLPHRQGTYAPIIGRCHYCFATDP
jgi:hypothetical protein